jgi:hypothetical protein
VQGRPDAGADREAAAAVLDRPAQQVLQGVDRPHHVGLGMQAAQDHRELVAAQPRHGVARAEGRVQHLGQAFQQGVARVVAQGVVDVLEVVDVDHDQAEQLAHDLRGVDGLLELAIEIRPVRQAGQAVLERQVLDGLGLAAAVGDVLEQIDQPFGLAVGPQELLPDRAHPGLDPVGPIEAEFEDLGLAVLPVADQLGHLLAVVGVDDLQRVVLEQAPLLQLGRGARAVDLAGPQVVFADHQVVQLQRHLQPLLVALGLQGGLGIAADVAGGDDHRQGAAALGSPLNGLGGGEFGAPDPRLGPAHRDGAVARERLAERHAALQAVDVLGAGQGAAEVVADLQAGRQAMAFPVGTDGRQAEGAVHQGRGERRMAHEGLEGVHLGARSLVVRGRGRDIGAHGGARHGRVVDFLFVFLGLVVTELR